MHKIIDGLKINATLYIQYTCQPADPPEFQASKVQTHDYSPAVTQLGYDTCAHEILCFGSFDSASHKKYTFMLIFSIQSLFINVLNRE